MLAAVNRSYWDSLARGILYACRHKRCEGYTELWVLGLLHQLDRLPSRTRVSSSLFGVSVISALASS